MTSQTIRPDFPSAIDSTLLGTFRSCPQKAFRMYFQHWKPQGESVHLVAGAAFARGLEVARELFYDGGYDSETAIAQGLNALMKKYGDFQCPGDSAKSLERMCGALEFYFDRYPLESDSAKPILMPTGKHAIEFSFAEPLPVKHPVTGDPLLYTGRSDMLCEYAGGRFVEDDKTTSSLGASWARQWEMRSQFTGYTWAGQRAGIELNGILVRGVSILKTKYDTAEVVTYRSPYEIDRWLEQTCRDLERMKAAWESGAWDYNLDHACSEYGGCVLQSVCKSNDPEAWLPMYFERRKWDPLVREETLVDEEGRALTEPSHGAAAATEVIPLAELLGGNTLR